MQIPKTHFFPLLYVIFKRSFHFIMCCWVLHLKAVLTKFTLVLDIFYQLFYLSCKKNFLLANKNKLKRIACYASFTYKHLWGIDKKNLLTKRNWNASTIMSVTCNGVQQCDRCVLKKNDNSYKLIKFDFFLYKKRIFQCSIFNCSGSWKKIKEDLQHWVRRRR